MSAYPECRGFGPNIHQKTYWEIFWRRTISAELDMDILRKFVAFKIPWRTLRTHRGSSRRCFPLRIADVFSFLYESFDNRVTDLSIKSIRYASLIGLPMLRNWRLTTLLYGYLKNNVYQQNPQINSRARTAHLLWMWKSIPALAFRPNHYSTGFC